MSAMKQARPEKSQVGSIEDEIARTEERLKKLKEKQREDLRKKMEKNQRAVAELIKKHKLDQVSIETWESKVADIQRALGVQAGNQGSGGSGGVSDSSVGQ